MSPIAGNQIIGRGRLGAFNEAVVVGIRRYFKSGHRFERATADRKVEEPLDVGWLKPKLVEKNAPVFGQDWLRYAPDQFSIANQVQNGRLAPSRLEDPGYNDVCVDHRLHRRERLRLFLSALISWRVSVMTASISRFVIRWSPAARASARNKRSASANVAGFIADCCS
jgi:hypothetical protein